MSAHSAQPAADCRWRRSVKGAQQPPKKLKKSAVLLLKPQKKAKELDSGSDGGPSGGVDAELSSYGKKGRALGPVVGAFGEMSDGAYIIAETVAEELATEHRGFYSDKKQNVVAASFLSQTHRSWGLVAHRRWAVLMLDHRCLVEIPNAPRHCSGRAHAEAGYDEASNFDIYSSSEASSRTGPGGETDAESETLADTAWASPRHYRFAVWFRTGRCRGLLSPHVPHHEGDASRKSMLPLLSATDSTPPLFSLPLLSNTGCAQVGLDGPWA